VMRRWVAGTEQSAVAEPSIRPPGGRAYWCDACRVPLLQSPCSVCGQDGRAVSSSNMRPVFAGEIRSLLALGAPSWLGPPRDFALWESGGRYYMGGYAIARLRRAPAPRRVSVEPIGKPAAQDARRRRSPLMRRLVAANYPRLRELEHQACVFIQEAVSVYPDRTLVVSFSGGKDSTVVSHLVRTALGRADILHMFADTGIEMPDTYRFLDTFRRDRPSVPLMVIRASADFFQLCHEIGPPSRIQRWCCSTQKAVPLGSVVNAANGAKGVLCFDGIRRAESSRRNGYLRITTKTKIGREVLASPILDWTDLEVWIYGLSAGLPINEAYLRGFKRVGCLYCPLNSAWSEALTALHYSNEHELWIATLRESACRAGHPDPDAFAQGAWRARAGGRGLASFRASVAASPCESHPHRVSYQTTGDWRDTLWSYIGMLGKLRIWHDDGMIAVGVLQDASGADLMSFRAVRPRQRLEVTYADGKGHRLLRQRIERQLRKYQSCVSCGACAAICPTGALSMHDSLIFNERLCTFCLKCVSMNCVAVESLTLKGRSTGAD